MDFRIMLFLAMLAIAGFAIRKTRRSEKKETADADP